MIEIRHTTLEIERRIEDILFGLMKSFKFNPLRARRLLSLGEKLAEEKTFANKDGSTVLILAVARNGLAFDCTVSVTRKGVTERVVISHSQTRLTWDWERGNRMVPIDTIETLDALIGALERLIG